MSDKIIPEPTADPVPAMAHAIVQSRDLCGDEREAAIEACHEVTGSRPTPHELHQAFARADGTWRRYQREAGVAAKYCDGRGGLHDPGVTRALESGD